MPSTPSGPRVVLVVGGTSGIGLATARQLVERGDTVVVGARDAGRVASVAAELGGGTTGVALEVTDAASVDAAVERCVADHGRLDGVVTSAQTMAYGTVEQVPADVFAAVVDTAVIGTVHLAQAVLPVFRRQGGGQLVVVSSLLAEMSVPSMTAYCTAKWGQLGLVRGLQLEVRRERGIGVSIVLPGAVDTPIYHQAATYGGSAGSAPPPVVSPSGSPRPASARWTTRAG
ncbi:3-oxoacyl-[acyl-carrier-protein] reductase FabG [Nocardioides aquaticus]|uniref:3-oxoacyl-[acyl-carrier-protein] reductase FabG n=1 Tax=Nocardioides aquaticus TaxID=160826 RepID=A0ABX8EDK7_9ACTN|nr:SDR family NAD(P)-dependent oxidoreductase [Nocardioides aquaticus]QVT78552.1 3-oxoacyl-[acyl-carrier-protein] reductase FabG [Nocardioides aquaticus]